MKSIVVEIKGKYAAILSDDGSVTKIRNHNYAVGQEVLLEKAGYQPKADNGLLLQEKEKGMIMNKLHITKKLAVCAACVVLLLLCSGTVAWAYTSPYSYVSLDVNPSIYYTLNRFDQVINVKAVNDDGKVILEKINISGLKYKSIEKAILSTVQEITKEGYFTRDYTQTVTGSAIQVPDSTNTGTNVVTGSAIQVPGSTNTVTGSAISIDGGIVITVSSGNAKLSHGLVKDIRKSVKDFVKENVVVEVSSVGLDRVKEARELGVTPGKLNLVEKLKKSAADPESIVIEEWLDKPVKVIMQEIKKNKKAAVTADETAEVKTQEDTDSGNTDIDKVKEEKKNTDKIDNKKVKKEKVKKEKDDKENITNSDKDKEDTIKSQDKKENVKSEKASDKIEKKELKKQSKEALKAKKEEEKEQKAETKDQKKYEKDTEKSQYSGDIKDEEEQDDQGNSNKSNGESYGKYKSSESSDSKSEKNPQHK
ncbi:anti-sigma-I factor RsgI family protein [Anaerocolumna chitinilytica]|uniref:RsgI N-terminal anti-sigma domain-containing protein n=1 Tax=Anaerocolumna chitinilytica TaxID=1727145 RepID=A0A7I8DH73_9FIRM|nr:hypothetical protein [Anaerocolumna chitinilytica]BCJ97858.1 hypothetical protein bsdcttw_08990 [Anaerocolumna chitinilytica]